MSSSARRTSSNRITRTRLKQKRSQKDSTTNGISAKLFRICILHIDGSGPLFMLLLALFASFAFLFFHQFDSRCTLVCGCGGCENSSSVWVLFRSLSTENSAAIAAVAAAACNTFWYAINSYFLFVHTSHDADEDDGNDVRDGICNRIDVVQCVTSIMWPHIKIMPTKYNSYLTELLFVDIITFAAANQQNNVRRATCDAAKWPNVKQC